MKARKIIGGLLAAAMVLTSVPLAGLGGNVTAKAADSAYQQLEVGGAWADNSQPWGNVEGITKAFDNDPNTQWHSNWATDPKGAEGTWNKGGGYSELTGRNTMTVALRTVSDVAYFEYTARTGNMEGIVRTMKVAVKTKGATDFTEVEGQQYGADGNPTDAWPREKGKTYQYRLTTPAKDVEAVRFTFTSSYANGATAGQDYSGVKYISAAEIKVYGNYNTPYGSAMITGLTGEADSVEYQQNNSARQLPASNAVDGNSSSYWHTNWDDTNLTPNNNTYTITLPAEYDVTAVTYQCRNDYSTGTKKITNGAIKKADIYVSTDNGSTWTYDGVTGVKPAGASIGTCVATSDWTYVNADSSGCEYNFVEKVWDLAANNGGKALEKVNKIKIVVTSTDGSAPDSFINAAEFRVYGKETPPEGTPIENVNLSIAEKPVAGNSVGQLVAESGATYDVSATTWTDKIGGTEADTYAKYKKYDASVTLTAQGNNVFTSDTKVKVTIGGEDVPCTVVRGEDGKTATVTAAYSGLSVSSIVYVDDDGDGEIVIPDEDMEFFNNLRGITVSVLLRFNETPVGGNYSLFTLSNEDGNYFTVWFNPQYDATRGNVTYAYPSSLPRLTFNKTGYYTTDTDWHKISVTLDKQSGMFAGCYDSKTDVLEQYDVVGTRHWPNTVMNGGYTKATVGKPAEGVTYTLGCTAFPGTIKCIEISESTYDKNTGLSSGVHSNVHKDKFEAEFNALKTSLDAVDEDDYRPEGWTDFSAAKTAAEAMDEATDWDYLNKMLKMEEVLAKAKSLTVCHHTYMDGKCTICGATFRADGIVGGEAVTKYTVKTKQTADGVPVSEDVNYGKVVTVNAGEAPTGKFFSHWSSSENGEEVLSRSKRYDFYVSKSMEVYAVYADQEVEAKPCIVNNNMYSSDVATSKYVNFEFTRDVPEGWTMVKQGVLYGTSSSKFGQSGDAATNLQFADENYDVTKEKVWKYEGKSTSRRGVYILTLNIGTRTASTVYARGYIVAQKGDKTEVFYSPVVSGSYDALSATK